MNPVRHNTMAMKKELGEKVATALPDRANDHRELVVETIDKLREIGCAGNDTPDHVNDAAEAKLVVILTHLIDLVKANAEAPDPVFTPTEVA